MADAKISALTNLTAADAINDMIPIVDVSDTPPASGNTKRISINNLLSSSPTASGALTVTGLVTAGSAAITGDLTVATNKLKVTGGNVGIGTATPTIYANYTTLTINGTNGGDIDLSDGGTLRGQLFSESTGLTLAAVGGLIKFGAGAGGTEKMRLDSSGNVGLGVTPSLWQSGLKAIQFAANGVLYANGTSGNFFGTNFFTDSTGTNKYLLSSQFANAYAQLSGAHIWYNAPDSGVSGAGTTATFTPAMTLDTSGNLLVGTTSGSNSRIIKAVTAGTTVFEVTGTAGYGSFFQSGDAQGSSSALSIANIGKVVSTGRSINAGGTVNASGADYAEYMVKCSDFVLSKGDVSGIDANGKLTNVFADAVSFVVKSTDPSYVGNDKWGVDLEGDALETARQLVDRIAFAGQVPVNVTGATAGDYIVPVVNGTGIKGISVSKPTFDQYQLAVGKVIAIDADGRARIIVKVA